MKKILFIATLLFVTGFSSQAQVETVELEEVVIEAMPFEKYISGSKIEKSDSLEMARHDNRTLANYLQQNSTIYVKEQGNGMLASISFRGTGSSHTGIFWHGLNLNALTLGNSDFNSFPLFLFDDIAVQYGGASSLHGSDAIGGSIHLNSSPGWTKGSKVQIQQDIGSFGNVFSGVKVDIGNGKWESKTRVFNRLLKNNFTYSMTDRLGDSYEINQENASIHNWGALQQFNRKITRNGYLSLKGWFGQNHNQVQPMMVTQPEEQQDGEQITNKNVRLLAEYNHFFNKGLMNSSIGYVWDNQLYIDENGEEFLIETNRGVANLSGELDLNEKTAFKVGGNAKYIVPNVWSYGENIAEWRTDIFLSLIHELITSWQISANARKTFVPFTNSPVAPSLSTSYNILKSNYQMTFRGQVERSFRVPTLNDRYWPLPGIENRELNSERGYSGELGHNFTYQTGKFSLENDISTYYMIVDDWIMWVPYGNNWKPENKKKVEASGVEFTTKLSWEFPSSSLELGGMYAYSRSVLLKGISDDDPAIGNQLPYTPRHRGVLFATYLFKKYHFSVINNFTGERNGMDQNEIVDGFLITDIEFARNFKLGRQLFSIEGKILNAFNEEYQNVARYAMPGRNYLMSINFFINN
jgi:iron complex outermembrane receptor protein